ncbi:hypothetical protein DPMN_007652 [Dreissena polymorpha]|uniref:Uncharacterized protein n=1 Tax=Dreissena polymorpha TaxID=45954 RepID=A0A9D4MXD6_DREPO|nr:hypothetical protein DPMN_007652 [Dreissena polymorpha]
MTHGKTPKNLREAALSYRHMKVGERLFERSWGLTPLKIGDFVWIQNQTGRYRSCVVIQLFFQPSSTDNCHENTGRIDARASVEYFSFAFCN